MVKEISNGGPVSDDESDGVRFESDLDSLCSDEEEQSTKKSRREYNPHATRDNVRLKLSMVFRCNSNKYRLETSSCDSRLRQSYAKIVFFFSIRNSQLSCDEEESLDFGDSPILISCWFGFLNLGLWGFWVSKFMDFASCFPYHNISK